MKLRKLLIMLKKTANFQIDCLGEKEEDVYDLEVKDTHNFFGNGILLHNSVTFNLDPLVKKLDVKLGNRRKFLEEVTTKKIRPVVNEICADVCKQMNSYENHINFKLESVSSTDIPGGGGAIWVAKKKYVILVESSEGVVYSKPKFKVTGLEMIRSSTPQFCREKLRNALDVIFSGGEDNIHKYIRDVKKEFLALRAEEIAFPRTANNIDSFADRDSIYGKGTPIHVRGSLLYNFWVRKLKLEGKYPLIHDGDKIKFSYLSMPNKIRENVVAFPADGKIPEEFGVLDRVDRELQFEKSVIAPMQILLTAVKWHTEPVATLDAFFE